MERERTMNNKHKAKSCILDQASSSIKNTALKVLSERFVRVEESDLRICMKKSNLSV